MVSYYLVKYRNKKPIRSTTRFASLTSARKAAQFFGVTVDHPVYVEKVYADGSHGIDNEAVEYYPGEGYVWRTNRAKGYPEYYPLRKDGTIGKKHRY